MIHMSLTADEVVEVLLDLIKPHIKGNVGGVPQFRRSLTADELEILFSSIYEIITAVRQGE